MNSYYLITASKIDDARQYALTEGLPNQLFQVTINPTGDLAIVQAEWTDIAAMDALGTNLGELQADGSAPQAIYDELAKSEWQWSE
jgi:hypothetical protein